MSAGAGMMGAGIVMSIIGDVMAANEQGRVADIMRSLPLLEKVDFTQEQANTIKGNLQNLPEAQKLSTQANLANVESVKKSMAAMGLDWDKWNRLVNANVTSGLQGRPLTEDMSALVRKNAAKALSGGFAGSGMHGAMTARDLGLQSMQVRNNALQQAESWLASTKSFMPEPLSVSSMMLTPQQRIQFGMAQNQAYYQSVMANRLGQVTPGVTGAYGSLLQERGGQMMGMGGMMGGFGGGSKPKSTMTNQGGTGGIFYGM